MSSRAHTHPSLPAPTLHAGYSSSQSKSHVLAGVQDAYWSDDDAEDAECPLCLEEMDISDLNFKPCVCGYQICRFCWHHIKENLNGLCPACRREYTEDGVQFKPINPEDHKRLTQQKKQRERERKELDALGRRNLANVRVVQRNVVYVTGLGSRFAKEELIPTLRSNEYFGQYGKIAKIVITKRTSPGNGSPVIGLYITYHRREDATRCIAVVDGAPPPGGGSEVMRASHGTTKYCMNFLRGAACNDHSCMNLHEWGDEKDCFTKEDLTTLKHTMKDSETRARTAGKRGDEPEGALPRAAAWASKSTLAAASTPSATTSRRDARRGVESTKQSRSSTAATADKTSRGGRASAPDRKGTTHTKTPSQASSSRPSTPALAASLPARPTTPVTTEAKSAQQRAPSVARPSSTAAGTTAAATKSAEASVPPRAEASPAVQDDTPSVPVPPASLPQPTSASTTASPALAPALPPGIPTAPPGLPAAPTHPPGIPTTTASPQLAKQPSAGSYQMSNAARALLEDVTARRGTAPAAGGAAQPPPPPPFPELDDTLRALRLDGVEGNGTTFGGFSFNLDLALADNEEIADTDQFGFQPDQPKSEADTPFIGGDFMAAFPALRPSPGAPTTSTFSATQQIHQPPPPGFSFNHTPNRSIYDPLSHRSSAPEVITTSYSGSFDPFGDSGPLEGAHVLGRNNMHPNAGHGGDEDRKMSRFGFARARQANGSSAAASPVPTLGSLGGDLTGPGSFYSSDVLPPSAGPPSQGSWMGRADMGLGMHYVPPESQGSSPMLSHAQVQGPFAPQPTRYQNMDHNISEAQLRDFIHSSRGRATPASSDRRSNPSPFAYGHNQGFQDPAIMSASVAASMSPGHLMTPPGLGGDFGGYMPTHTAPQAQNFTQSPALVFGPPPGLASRQQSGNGVNSSLPGFGVNSPLDPSRINSAQVSTTNSPSPSSPPPLSTSDFPVLSVIETPSIASKSPTQHGSPGTLDSPLVNADSGSQLTIVEAAAKEKAERKAAKKAAAAERAVERARLVQERTMARAAEKAKLAAEKAAERGKAATAKAEKEMELKERTEREKAEKTRLRAEKVEKERLEKEKAEKKANERREATEKVAETKKATAEKQKATTTTKASLISNIATTSQAAGSAANTPTQTPILSRMPKKNRPVAKPIRIPKEDDVVCDAASSVPSASVAEAPQSPVTRTPVDSEALVSAPRSSPFDRAQAEPASLEELLDQIDIAQPWMNLLEHPFFDISKINPAAKMPLEYGPLVHALSALSVGGGSFANNMPSGSIDHAVSSFQQLLETLTQTISDLLRLLPRTTWDDSSSFDGVLRDMLRGDDFLDDAGEDGNMRADEVAALTLALERRARWMEVQLSKLEELHRDINTAAVRAVLSFNDRGWDRHGFMPRVGNTLARFNSLGCVKEDNGIMRPMTVDELEKKLAVAKEAAVFAETELRESMEAMQGLRCAEDEH